MKTLLLIVGMAAMRSSNAASCKFSYDKDGGKYTWTIMDIESPDCCLEAKKDPSKPHDCLKGLSASITFSAGGVACTGTEKCNVPLAALDGVKVKSMDYYTLPEDWCKYLQTEEPPLPASSLPKEYCVAAGVTFGAATWEISATVGTPELCEDNTCDAAGCTCWSTCNVLPVSRSCGNPPEGFKYSKTGETGNKDGCGTTFPNNNRDQCELFAVTPTAKCNTHPGCWGLDGDCCPISNGTNLGCCSKEANFCEDNSCNKAGCTCWSTCSVVDTERSCGDAPAGFAWKKINPTEHLGTGCSSLPGNNRDQCELVTATASQVVV